MWTSGPPDEVTAYRSELQGIHAILLALSALCEFHTIPSGKVHISCDNLTSVKEAGYEFLKVALAKSNADLIRAIRRLRHELPITISFSHVKGHQDDELWFDKLTRVAQLNVLMDRLAKDFLLKLICLPLPTPPCPDTIRGEGWRCRVDGIKVMSDPEQQVLHSIFGNRMRQYLHERGRLHQDAFPLVDWTSIGEASEEMPALFQLWTSKHVHHFCGVGKNMLRWGFWDHSRCPCCQTTVETTSHLLVCPSEKMLASWEKSVTNLESWLNSVETHPDITHCIVSTLRERDLSSSFARNSSTDTREAALAQDAIGWQNFVEGKISTIWKSIQQTFYSEISSRRTARRWCRGLVSHLLELTHDQWATRNGVVHERDAQGLKLAEGAELTAAIIEQYNLGTDGLHPRDHHYLSRSLATILELPVMEKRQWVSTIRSARELYGKTTNSSMHQMRTFMENWLLD